MNRRGAQHAPVVRPPFTFSHILRPCFEFSPCACVWPRAAADEDEGVGLHGMLVMLSMLSYSSQILATQPIAASPTSRLTCQVPPTSSCCARMQSELSHCRPQSGLLTRHPSALTADSLLHTGVFIVRKITSYHSLLLKRATNSLGGVMVNMASVCTHVRTSSRTMMNLKYSEIHIFSILLSRSVRSELSVII